MNIHKNVSKIYASSGVNLDNSEKVKEVQNIACEHQIDDYLASLLYESKI